MAKDHDSVLPTPLRRGGYVARFAAGVDDLDAAARLRHLCFVEGAGRAPLAGGLERDRFDSVCDHVLVEDAAGRLVCCFRLMAFGSGADIGASYSAQYYDLAKLSQFESPLVEMGRFCVHSDAGDADVLRIAWGMLAAFVDAHGAGVLFGCSSFAGVDPTPYRGAFDLLAARHLAPEIWAPRAGSTQSIPYAKNAKAVDDRRAALAQVPSLLKTYLAMGGWVSDHAVIDADMNTLHVFTGLEIAAIPPARAQALRSVAG